MGSRFLNKRFVVLDGFSQGQGDDSAAFFFESDTGKVNRPLNVEGLMTSTMGITGSMTTGPLKVLGGITATAVTLNTVTVGSGTITNLLAGAVTGTAVTINTVVAGSGTITNLLTGAVTGTAVTINTVVVGSGAVTNLRVGSSAGNNLITAAWRTIYTWNMGAIVMGVGSTNSVITVDVAMSGVSVGDAVLATAIGSVDFCVNYAAACSSAANVQLRAWYTGSTGAYTPGNVPFKITAIQI